MKEVRLPDGYCLESLRRDRPRKSFRSGQKQVDDWLASQALQQQSKHLSATKVLLDAGGAIAGYYTLAPSQIDFGDLPPELSRHLLQRLLPVAVLAWLGIDTAHQRRGLGTLLLGRALRDCWEGGRIFPFIAVLLDSIDEQAKQFYTQFGFHPFPGQPYRLFLSAKQLDALVQA